MKGQPQPPASSFYNGVPAHPPNGSPACRAGQYRVELGSNGAGGELALSVDAVYVQGSACHLDLPIELSLQYPDGQAMPVRGIPIRTRIVENLGSDEDGTTEGFVYGWANWCGGNPPFSWVGQTPSGTTSFEIPQSMPACENDTVPSSIHTFADHG